MFLPSCSGRPLLKELEMHPTIVPVVLLSLLLLPALSPAAAASGDAVQVRVLAAVPTPPNQRLDGAPSSSAEHWPQTLARAMARVSALLAAGYWRAPALVVVSSALIALPLAALLSFLVGAAGRRKSRRAAMRLAAWRLQHAPAAEEARPPSRPSLWAQQAWLTLETGTTGSTATLPLTGGLLRLGRRLGPIGRT